MASSKPLAPRSALPPSLVCSSLASLAVKTLAGNGPAAPSLLSAKLLAIPSAPAPPAEFLANPSGKPACNLLAFLRRFFNRLQRGPLVAPQFLPRFVQGNRYQPR